MKKSVTAVFFVLYGVFILNAQPIPTNYFGINAWMPDTIGNTASCPGGAGNPCLLYGKLNDLWSSRVEASAPSLVRYGGINADLNFPTNYQYLRMIDSIRAIGAEPVLQVSVWDGTYTAAQAAALVSFINITRGKNVMYWSIGNEPNLKYAFRNNATQIAIYVKAFSSAMKQVDPTIKILAPDLAWFDKAIFFDEFGGWNDGLLCVGNPAASFPNDITGIVPGKSYYYVDVVTYHIYPFNGTQNKGAVISNVPVTITNEMTQLKSFIDAANLFHTRNGSNALKFAVTEFNINYQNPATNDVYNTGTHSFINGQFWAEVFAVGMKYQAAFAFPWSIHESAGNRSTYDLGYLDNNTTYIPRSAYFHMQLMSQNFKGNYLNGISNRVNVKAFGCNSGTKIMVMILNEEDATDLNFTIRLNNAAVSGADALKINIDAGLPVEFIERINRKATHLYVFDLAGNIEARYVYEELDAATAIPRPPSYQVYDQFLRMGGLLQTMPAPGWIIDLTEWNRNYYTLSKSGVELNTTTSVSATNTLRKFTRIFARTTSIPSAGSINIGTNTFLHLRLKTINPQLSIRVELQDQSGNRTTANPFLINPVSNSGLPNVYAYDFNANLGCGGACKVDKTTISQLNFYVNCNGVAPFNGILTLTGLDFMNNPPLFTNFIIAEVHAEYSKNKITWLSNTDNLAYNYVVESHTDSGWINIKEVGSMNSMKLYECLDYTSRQEALYRIKQVNRDGSYFYSEVVHANNGSPSAKSFQNYPNPFSNQTEICYYIKEASDVGIYVADNMGRVVYEINTKHADAGNYCVGIDEKLPSGIYYYTFFVNTSYIDRHRMMVVR